MSLREEDIEFLDKILEWKVKKHPENSAGRYTDEAIRKSNGIEYDYYKYYIKLIADYSDNYREIVHVERGTGSIIISPLKIITENFINAGGFKNAYKEQEKEKYRKRRKEKLENFNSLTSSFKNLGWLIGLIFSLVINICYSLGIINFKFIKPKPVVKEIKESLKIHKENHRQTDTLYLENDSLDKRNTR